MFAEHFARGGPLMYPIAAMSAIAMALVLDRVFTLRHELVHAVFGRRSVGDRLSKLDPLSVDWERFRLSRDPVARALAAFHLEGRNQAREEGEQALSRSSRGLGALDTIVGLSTNVGLLGTVIGVIGVFPHYVTGDKELVVKYLSVALYTTVGGLVVFLYGYVALRAFRGCVERLAKRLEDATERAEAQREGVVV